MTDLDWRVNFRAWKKKKKKGKVHISYVKIVFHLLAWLMIFQVAVLQNIPLLTVPWAWCALAFCLVAEGRCSCLKLRWPGQLCLESGARVASCWQSPQARAAFLPSWIHSALVGLGTRNSGHGMSDTVLGAGLAFKGRGGPSAHTAPGWPQCQRPHGQPS